MDFSPAMSDMTDEEIDRYLANYVPLSNLPTPPPSKEGFGDGGRDEEERLEALEGSELAGPSTHLANLVPSNTSTRRPSPSTIHTFLLRAALPFETLAFAACILDALSTRFASAWRTSCSSPPLSNLSQSDSHHHPSTPPRTMTRSLSTAPTDPSLIVLTALSLSVSFLDDRPRRPTFWSDYVAEGAFTARLVHATEIAMLQDLDYGLHRFGPEMVEHAGEVMRRLQRERESKVVGREVEVEEGEGEGEGKLVKRTEEGTAKRDGNLKRPLRLSFKGLRGGGAGEAVWSENGLCTPGPSP